MGGEPIIIGRKHKIDNARKIFYYDNSIVKMPTYGRQYLYDLNSYWLFDSNLETYDDAYDVGKSGPPSSAFR